MAHPTLSLVPDKLELRFYDDYFVPGVIGEHAQI